MTPNPLTPPNNSMEPTRPAAANRVYDWFQELAGRLISRPLGSRTERSLKGRQLIAICTLTTLLQSCSAPTTQYPSTPGPSHPVTSPRSHDPTPPHWLSTIQERGTQEAAGTIVPTSTFRPTWTPTVQPTFTPYPFTEDSRPRFLLADFILPQPGCDLPCWNGLEAGQRLPEDLSPLLHALGINRDRIAPFNEAHYSWIRAPFSSYPYSILDPEDGGIWLVENGDRLATITLLATNLRNPPSTELHYVAQAIGIPDFIALTYTGPYGDYLLLDYVGLGIAIGLHHSLVPETPDAYPRLICMGRARAEADITFYTVLTHCDATHGYGQGCIPFGSEHTPTPLPALLGLSVENTFIKLQDPTQCFKMP